MRVVSEQHEAPTDDVDTDSVDTDPVNYFDGKFAQAIRLIPDELKLLSEDDLYERVNPTANDWKLRQSFTDLVKKARALNEDRILTTRVYEDVVSRQGFHTQILPNPLKLAWLTRPMVEHTDYYNAIHKLALSKIFRMVQELPLDAKYLPQILKIAETAGNRVHGPVVQRMQIQSKNLNVDVKQFNEALDPGSDQGEIQKRIEALQAKLIEAPKDVTPANDED